MVPGSRSVPGSKEDTLMSIHEECGVFGIYSPAPCNLATLSYYGLFALQHRGQESCGIVVNDDGVFTSHKDMGLVSEVFSEDVLNSFPDATMAVAHTRYGTTGGTNRSNCQPIEVNHQKGRMALAHNGNLSNAAAPAYRGQSPERPHGTCTQRQSFKCSCIKKHT